MASGQRPTFGRNSAGGGRAGPGSAFEALSEALTDALADRLQTLAFAPSKCAGRDTAEPCIQVRNLPAAVERVPWKPARRPIRTDGSDTLAGIGAGGAEPTPIIRRGDPAGARHLTAANDELAFFPNRECIALAADR